MAGSLPLRRRAGIEGDEGSELEKRLSGAQGEMEEMECWTRTVVDGGMEGGSRNQGEYRKPSDEITTDQRHDREINLTEH